MSVDYDHTSARDLSTFGYPQELVRKVGSYASFAAGFSFVSIMTTVFQLFGLGYSFGGTAFFWTWPAVLVGQLLVALCFAELAARYPISGAIYQWSRRMGGSVVGWFAGWTMVIAQTITIAAAAIALQVVLPIVWSGFQIIGTDTSVASRDGAANAILLGLALLVVTTLINAFSVKLTARVTSIGVTCELIGVALLVVLLFGHAERGPSVIVHHTNLDGSTGYVVPLLVSSLMAAYVLVGFDSAGELAEETHAPRRTTPRTIIRAVLASGVGGAFLIVAALMAAPSLGVDDLGLGGLPYVITSQLGTFWGKLLLLDVAFAVTVCTLAIQTAAARMFFSMARDHVLPFSKQLSRVSPKTEVPVLATVVPGVGAALFLVVNIGNAGLFLALSSVCIMLLYIAYLLVTVPLLKERLAGRFPTGGVDETGRPLFSLGRLGVPINIVAVLFQLVMAWNLGWPRAEVYDPYGAGWAVHYLPILVLVVTYGVGYVAYRAQKPAYEAAIGLTPAASSRAVGVDGIDGLEGEPA
ncbi:amino acid permease [Nocardioides sp. Kera G14]|uniref:amino acid permease n=1 Tax=Nocardioides sp. Kera G14 TaxID=2884264 RepID=UPI001D0F74C8|nr:amino acid permease [Nocardioides sp. Kera G14]UDY24331.1 amino acid permease [Nocardioides sp. Kera G14]